MTNNTEPTIDEILEITRYNLKTSPDEIFDKGVVINAKNLIEAHIAKEVTKARIDEGETIKATYGAWYNKLSKEHGVKQEIPHTAFHQIIEERIATLNGVKNK